MKLKNLLDPLLGVALLAALLFIPPLNAAPAELGQVKLEWDVPAGQENNYTGFAIYITTNSTLPQALWTLVTNTIGTNRTVTILVNKNAEVSYYAKGLNEWGASDPSNTTNTPPTLAGYKLKIDNISLSGTTGTVNLTALVPDNELKWFSGFGWYVSTNVALPTDVWTQKAVTGTKTASVQVDARFPTFYIGKGSNFWGWGSFGESTNLNSLPVGGFDLKVSRP